MSLLANGIGLRTDQIEQAVRKLLAGRRSHFIGVFAADRIPLLSTLHERLSLENRDSVCFVANTDPQSMPGKHWVAFVVFRAQPCVIDFFDSYGMPLSYFTTLYEECRKRGYLSDATIAVRRVNSHQLQSSQSFVCGHYCIFFLHLAIPNACVSRCSTRSRSLRTTSGTAVQLLVRYSSGHSAQVRDRNVAAAVNRLLSRHFRDRRTACSHAVQCTAQACTSRCCTTSFLIYSS